MANNPDTGVSLDIEQPKSGGGKKTCLIAGCGCATLVAILLVVVVVVAMMLQKPMQQMITSSITQAQESETLKEVMGDSVQISPQPDPIFGAQVDIDGQPLREMRFPVTGNVKGDLVLRLEVLSMTEINRHSMFVELEDGTVVELNPDEEFKLEINDGN